MGEGGVGRRGREGVDAAACNGESFLGLCVAVLAMATAVAAAALASYVVGMCCWKGCI